MSSKIKTNIQEQVIPQAQLKSSRQWGRIWNGLAATGFAASVISPLVLFLLHCQWPYLVAVGAAGVAVGTLALSPWLQKNLQPEQPKGPMQETEGRKRAKESKEYKNRWEKCSVDELKQEQERLEAEKAPIACKVVELRLSVEILGFASKDICESHERIDIVNNLIGFLAALEESMPPECRSLDILIDEVEQLSQIPQKQLQSKIDASIQIYRKFMPSIKAHVNAVAEKLIMKKPEQQATLLEDVMSSLRSNSFEAFALSSTQQIDVASTKAISDAFQSMSNELWECYNSSNLECTNASDLKKQLEDQWSSFINQVSQYQQKLITLQSYIELQTEKSESKE